MHSRLILYIPAYMHLQLDSKGTYGDAQFDALGNSFFVARGQLVLAAEQCAINVGGHKIKTSVCCLTHGSVGLSYSPGSAWAREL